MPGFFVDRQDYGGFLPTATWDNLLARTIESAGGLPPLVVDAQLGIGGSYDFWHDSILANVPRHRSLQTYANDPCCCPELFCCFPETVTATIAGFKEATRVPSRSIAKYANCNSEGSWNATIPPKTIGDYVWYTPISWCSAFIEENIPSRGGDCGQSCNLVPGVFWDEENSQCITTFEYKCCPESSVAWASAGDPRLGSCLDSCDPGNEANNYNISEGAAAADPNDTWNTICCPNYSPNDPNPSIYCDRNEDVGLQVCVAQKLGPNGEILDPNFRKDVGSLETSRDIIWPKSMFPPQSCNCIACCGGILYDEGPYQLFCLNTSYSVGEYYSIFESHISKQFNTLTVRPEILNYSWPEICNDTEFGLSILCEKPTTNNIIYGPNTYRATNPDGGQGPQIYDADHNGTYVCHKILNSFRPELEPFIERQFPLNRPEKEEDKARLLFEVECRRKMRFTACGCGLGQNLDQVIEGFNCDYKYPEPTQVDINNLEVPNNKIYCVDYPCQKVGRALPTYIDNAFVRQPTRGCTDPSADTGYCGIFACQADAGSAYPQLMLYQAISESGDGAAITFSTTPYVYEQEEPIAWQADNFVIVNPGSGYIIGDTFIVDFDATYIRRVLLPDGTYIWRGGQTYPKSPIHQQLDDLERVCEGPSANISPIEEKYNSVSPVDLVGFPFSSDPAFPFSFSFPHPVQTARVNSIGPNGEIESLERVPWFKETEYNDNGFCETKDNNKKTPIYPLYSRKLCHPQPVGYGGKGYSVGDTIVWLPANSGQDVKVWKNQYAFGYVTDVDEEGSILDWYISGGIDNLNETTHQRFYGDYEEDNAPLIGYLYNKGDAVYTSPCYGSSNPTFDGGLFGPEYDNRGYYYQTGTDLCSLSWAGVGVPIRARSSSYTDFNGSVSVGFLQDPTVNWNCSPSVIDYNGGYLTNLNLNISRVVAETSVGITVNKYRYIDSVYGRILAIEDGFGNPDIDGPLIRAILDFRPFPECVGGGSEIVPVIYNCSDPTNPNCGNESIFGGSLSGTIIKSPGAFHSFINRKHVEPILPKDIPDIVGISGVGTGATIDTFSFGSVNSFPGPSPDPQTNLKSIFDNPNYLERWTDISYNGLTPDRYAYFPLTNIQIDNPGSGYEIDQEFEIYPENGKPFTRSWVRDTADDPIACPNGGWYQEPYNTVDSNGLWNYTNQNPIILESKAKVKITEVDENGGIISVDIINQGMMFRCVETEGILHPDVIPYLDSTLGYGAIPNVVVDTNKNSSNFGRITNFYFTNPVFFAEYDEFGQLTSYGGYDPLHSNFGVNPPVLVGWSGSPTKGYGRDYANPDNGYFWMLNNVSIDTDVKLLAYYPFGDAFNGPISTQYYLHQSGAVPYDYVHPEYSTHRIVEGTMPNYVPKSTICSFNDCYHDLLNKTYPLYRSWSGNDDIEGPNIAGAAPGYDDNLESCIPPCENNSNPFGTNNTYEVSGRPLSNYCLLLKNGKSINYDCNPDGSINFEGENTINYARGLDYIVVEYGFTMTLNATISECPDHNKGRTVDGNDDYSYLYV